MSGILVVAAIAVVALAYVAAPIRRRDAAVALDPRVELEEQKTRALRAILELEDERDVGKLSDEDLAELRVVYETEALDALHQLDATVSDQEGDPLEREIAMVRRRLSGKRCSSCGAPRSPSDETCPRCGA